jgi:hypothetical protein
MDCDIISEILERQRRRLWPMDLDRKMASPTESAVTRDLAKGTLRSRYAEAAVNP